MRARAAVACATAGVIIGCVGCTSGPAHPQASHTRSTAPASLALPDRALLSPGCNAATAKSPVVATVAAGCNPVRVITSADGREVWVTARASDDLLCFSAAALRTDPDRALVAIVRVGEAPVGLMLVRNGSLVVVADSNRFGALGANSDLSVVDAACAWLEPAPMPGP